MRVCRSPWLIAAYHGLHRLRVPRHPPHAFARLTTTSVGQAEHALVTFEPPGRVLPRSVWCSMMIRSMGGAWLGSDVCACASTLPSLRMRAHPHDLHHFRCQTARRHALACGPSTRGSRATSKPRRHRMREGCARPRLTPGLSGDHARTLSRGGGALLITPERR
jgi:hypothetical protein